MVIAHEKGEEEAPAMMKEESRFVLIVLDIILVTGGGSEAVVTVFILLLLLLKQEQHKQRKEGGANDEENEHALMSFILAVFGFLLLRRLPPWCWCSQRGNNGEYFNNISVRGVNQRKLVMYRNSNQDILRAQNPYDSGVEIQLR